MEEAQINPQENPQVIPETKNLNFKTPLVVGFMIVLLGVATGYFLVQKNQSGNLSSSANTKGETVGSNNEKVFKDTAIGVVEQGGLKDIGTHKLIRDGGPSQVACLTSSVVDLDQLVGKKVQIWGDTQKTECPWFMDVGKVKVL